MSSRFFCSNFSFFILGPCVEHFFLLFSDLLLVFQYLAFFFSPLFLVGVPNFFLSLELSSFLSVVSIFVLGPCVEHFFLLFSNLLLVFQYLAFFFSPLFWFGVLHFFLSLELSSFLPVVSFFGWGSTVFFCFF